MKSILSLILCISFLAICVISTTDNINDKDSGNEIYRIELYDGVCRGKPNEILEVKEGECITQVNLWVCPNGPTKLMNYSFGDEMVFAWY